MAAKPAEKHDLKIDEKYDGGLDFPLIAPAPQFGHPGYLTETQEAQVSQLRMMLEAEGYTERLDTLTLLRFLRARKFDVELAKKMFVECEKWRKEFGGGVGHLTKYFEYKEKPQDGRPLYIEHLGKIDLNKISQITTNERMLQNLVVEYERCADPRLPACSRKAGVLIETCCSIFDAKGVGLTSISTVYSYLQMASGISQNYYPERLGRLYIVNAPWGFSSAFSVVKKFLDPVTVSKIHILGSGFEKELLTQVPKENLPKRFGGTCECKGGCEFSDLGPWKDEKYAKPAKWEIEKKREEEEKASTAAPAAS